MPNAAVLAAIVAYSLLTADRAAAEDARMLPYAAPDRLVDIGGRRIHLHCMGSGGPTVILMSGISSWSPVWHKTHAEIAKRTQVCTFDRAAYGFSDPAPAPQVLTDVVEDLRAALRAAALPGPYVLVGHSLGGLEARLYAGRWPDEINSVPPSWPEASITSTLPPRRLAKIAAGSPALPPPTMTTS
jgi:pimeloyl-ACP methyl ester carboxylesterase